MASQSYEEKREEKLHVREQERLATRRSSRMRALRKWIIVIMIAAGFGAGIILFLGRQLPEGEDMSRTVPLQGVEHIAQGAAHPPYNSNPPTSGWHYADPARSGFYTNAVADETVIHNLEHGDVWVAYHPRIPDEVKNALRDFALTKVIITLREENDMDITLAAWGRIDMFDLADGNLSDADRARIDGFIKRYRNRGPERVLSSP
ncbi:MAG: DUF3105 domain-containing protein [Parcubacteria group bacterium]|nr:DUF3105 domain-containing protein [Parcubacteria group bacterium]